MPVPEKHCKHKTLFPPEKKSHDVSESVSLFSAKKHNEVTHFLVCSYGINIRTRPRTW